MKRMKMVLGTMILAVGMVGAASAQPAPDHDRDNQRYTYRDDDDNYRRGDRDDQRGWWVNGDRDDYYGRQAVRRDRDDWHGQRDARSSGHRGRDDMRRNDRDRR